MGSSQAAPLPPPPAVKPVVEPAQLLVLVPGGVPRDPGIGHATRTGDWDGSACVQCPRLHVADRSRLRLTSASGSSGRILRRVVLCILGSLSLRGVALCGSWFVACGAVHRTPYTVHRTQGLAIVPRDRFLPSLQIAGYGS